jgi:type I restriction enzyme S subunit
VKGGRILQPEEFIAEDDYDAWMRRGIPHAGDVLVTTEAPLGEVSQLDGRKVALAQRLIALRGKVDILDNRFLKFAMLSQFVQDQLRARATGTTVHGVRQSALRKINLQIPPIAEQRAIAEHLGKIDDAIELNLRMNATLEEIFRALFQFWFVDFGPARAKIEGHWKQGESFPGAPADSWDLWPDSLVDSEMGEIPKGSEAGVLGELCRFSRDTVAPDSVDPSLPYVGLEHMQPRNLTVPMPGKIGEVKTAKTKFDVGDVLFGRLRPYFHKVAVACEPGFCSTTIAVARPVKEDWRGVLIGYMDNDAFVDYAVARSNGTTMPAVSSHEMAGYPLVIPQAALARRFTEFTRPFLLSMKANCLQTRTLTAVGNTLLPKLLSGEIRIPLNGGR